MKDSLGWSGDACHQGPRTRARAVTQHALAQFFPRPEQPGLGSGYRDAQARGEIMHRQLFHVAHHYDLPQERRNSPDLGIQDVENLSLAEFALGIGVRCRHLDGSVPTLGISVVQLDDPNPTPLANKHKALVLDDPQQPSGELRLSMELIDVLESLPTCILRFFLSLAVVS